MERIQASQPDRGVPPDPTLPEVKALEEAEAALADIHDLIATAEEAQKSLEDAQEKVARRPAPDDLQKIGDGAKLNGVAVREVVDVISKNDTPSSFATL